MTSIATSVGTSESRIPVKMKSDVFERIVSSLGVWSANLGTGFNPRLRNRRTDSPTRSGNSRPSR